jgi:hypothetical protein
MPQNLAKFMLTVQNTRGDFRNGRIRWKLANDPFGDGVPPTPASRE